MSGTGMPVVGKKEERDMPSSPFMQKTFVMLKLLMQERRVHGRVYEPQNTRLYGFL